ncbi:MAG TPA: pseudouridine synthase [Terracidiphilus sp.]|jgi:23S rRNA pseudouridine2605 synthase|nr:pseudouridine synthase [Terracidiphilus sp.]
MTNDNEHPADAPEQEITSEAPEFANEQAETTVIQRPRSKSAKSAEQQKESADEEPAPHLERLQKILAQAGIASRRHAEELITGGRVQVNGQTVTVLGTKADPQRDHIRVDGKLLHGAERMRYFVLNKPKGFVTTVTDPENRPTVMQFFAKMSERLYPVGRLDFQSEGLLLVTNDGELANQLTKASSGVEKTYLVKVAGHPDEEQLERLRSGVAIDKGRPLEGKVRTAPAHIRQIRKGDNPWFEVVLIEGRNRELRKMFEEIGHHVEKIRRVGYGPLMLDVEPGKIRELATEEVAALRATAEGKMKPRRVKSTHMLPKDAGKRAEDREKPRRAVRPPAGERPDFRSERSSERRSAPAPQFGGRPPARFDKGSRPVGDRPRVGRTDERGGGRPKFGARPAVRFDQDTRPPRGGPGLRIERADDRGSDARPKFDARPAGGFDKADRPASAGSGLRIERTDDRGSDARPKFGARPAGRFDKSARPAGDRPGKDRRFEPSGDRGKPRFERREGSREGFKRPPRDARGEGEAPRTFKPRGPAKAGGFGDRGKPRFERKEGSREGFQRPPRGEGEAPRTFKPRGPAKAGGFGDRGKPRFERKEGSREGFQRPPRGEGEAPRTFKPRGPAKAGGFGDRGKPRFERKEGSREGFQRPPRGEGREERSQRPAEFRGGGPKKFGDRTQRSGAPARPFQRGRADSGGGAPKREGAARPFRGDRKPGAPFRGKPGSKPGGSSKRPPSRPGGKRTFGRKPK